MTEPGVARPGALQNVSGFALALDRRYEPSTHMWVMVTAAGPARIGLDPLGVETSGTLAQLSLPEPGAALSAGRPFGQMEAVKFVGPLTSPVSGTVRAVNVAAAADPGVVERDPFGAGWLIDADLSDPSGLDALIADPEEIIAWYAGRIAEYRMSGAIAQ
jgi:glycine cleavage system H protein